MATCLRGTASGSPSVRIEMGRTKTTDANRGLDGYLTEDAVIWFADWLRVAEISGGTILRRIDRWGNIGGAALSPAAVNMIVKQRPAGIGEDPKLYSAHGLRSGFLTTAAMDGVPPGSAMAQSCHRSTAQAMAYLNEVDRRNGAAARLLDEPSTDHTSW